MIVRSGSVERRSPSGFLAMLRLQFRLIGPSAGIFAALLLMVDVGGRLQPQLKSLEAEDRGAIQLLLILLCPLVLSFVSAERESFPLIIIWPMKLGRVIFAKFLAVITLSLMLFSLAFLLADLQILLDQELWNIPGTGGAIGGVLYISILGQGICLAERSLLPRIAALLGWILSAYLTTLLIIQANNSNEAIELSRLNFIVAPMLSGLTILIVSLVALAGAGRLAIGRFRRWQIHGSVLLVLLTLPGLYLFNLYVAKIPGPIEQINYQSILFPRFEFRYRLNAISGSPERFGFRQPKEIRFETYFTREGWLFGYIPFDVVGRRRNAFLKNVETGASIELPSRSYIWRISEELWVLRFENQGVDSVRLVLSPLRNLRIGREIFLDGAGPFFGRYGIDIVKVSDDKEIIGSSEDYYVSDPRKKSQTATKIPSSSSLTECARFVRCKLDGTDLCRLHDVVANETLSIEMNTGATVGCDEKMLGLVHMENGAATGIALYPLGKRVDLARRHWIDIEPSILLGTSNEIPYIFRQQGIVSALDPGRPVLKLDSSFGQPERLAQVPGTGFSLLTLSEGKTLLLDPAMRKYWALNYEIKLWPQRAFLSLERATLALLYERGDSVRCSLATGECKAQSAEDLPITWIDID